jgi:L-ribulose-5-phosphate 3-epimerase
MLKKSTGDNFFPKGLSFSDGAKLLKRASYDGVELWLGERPWFQMKTSDTEVRALLAQAGDSGLAISDVANALDWDENISDRDPAKREAAFRHIERQIEVAQMANTDAVLVVAGLVTEQVPYNEVYKRTVDGLQRLAPIAAKAKVRIGVENCNSEQRFLLSPREFQTFLQDVGSPWVGIHLDVGNIHDTGFAEQWIEIHGPHITRIHLKDVHKHRGRCGNQSVYTNIFLGDNNWAAVMQAIDKVGYSGWLIAEMEERYQYAADQQVFDTSAAMSRLIEGRL